MWEMKSAKDLAEIFNGSNLGSSFHLTAIAGAQEFPYKYTCHFASDLYDLELSQEEVAELSRSSESEITNCFALKIRPIIDSKVNFRS